MWYLDRRAKLKDLRATITDPKNGTPREELRALLRELEAATSRDPAAAFRFDAEGRATLLAANRRYQAGRFETPSLGELRARVKARSFAGAEAPERTGLLGRVLRKVLPQEERGLRFFVLEGSDPLTDIGTLQATAPSGTLFQVASQFNCLESPGPYLTPIEEYTDDPTQGPRASVSAFPGTFLRHYAAPDPRGGRLTQRGSAQINLLADAFAPSLAEVESGYLMTSAIRDPQKLAATLEQNFETIRVGVHSGVEVVFGYDWGGPVEGFQEISQVLTSTMALGGYSEQGGEEITAICRQLLRAAYLGTLLAALDLGAPAAVLTLIGGGVFGNPIPLIWDSILWAYEELKPLSASLDVIVNGRALSAYVPKEELQGAVKARGGKHLEITLGALSVS
jgi:hypothetical protein